MARLKSEFLDRVESFADRVLDVAEAVDRKPVGRVLVNQLVRSGTSVGANAFEASEAMSRADFVRALGISIRELAETRYWLRLIGRRNWVPAKRLASLELESVELTRILGTMIANTRRRESVKGT